jgi:hypothetical protein
VIYAYDDRVVQLLTLRRRDEQTYDNLDELEVQQLDGFRMIEGTQPSAAKIAEWEELAKKWAAPKTKPLEGLPQPITAAMLEKLSVPLAFRASLMQMKTADELLECPDVPIEWREAVLDCICPRSPDASPQDIKPIVVLEDLIDPGAAVACGPIDASDNKDLEPGGLPRFSGAKLGGEKSGRPIRLKLPAAVSVVSTRQEEPMKPYPGNTAHGIAQDTRYTVKLDGAVQLVYSVGNDERALLTTDGHPELVQLVNEAKRRGGSAQGGGSFVINEYRHVLVPTQSGEVLYAGVYTRDLEFDFEGTLISPVAPSSIRQGQEWPGPHVGIKYTLAAGATDVRYEEETARGTLRRISLTDHHSLDALSELLAMFRAVKPNGGAVYVNEARESFAPVDDGTGYKRRYIGHIGGKPWFPEPV